MQSRDRKVTREDNEMYYKNKTHQIIFEEQVNGNPCKCPNEYLAALYLLTADRDLWRAAKYEIERKVIDFSKIRPKEYTTNNYNLAPQEIRIDFAVLPAASLYFLYCLRAK